MPGRDTYLTDDDDTPRRAAASGGGVPGWVWGTGGAVVFVVLLVGSFAVAFFNKREALQREHVARAELARAEAMRKADVHAEKKAVAGPPAIPLTQFTNAYKTDRGKAEERYANKRVRVRVEVKRSEEGFAGTSADIGFGDPGKARPNVLFWFDGGDFVEVGTTVVIEGHCAGLSRHPNLGHALVFNNCRVVSE